MMKIFHSIVIILVAVSVLKSQPNFPENGQLYTDEVVPRIDITIDPDTLEWLYEHENLESDIEYSARFIFDNGIIKDTIDPVGFRLRGNTSRYSQKKSFKVSFNTFTSGGKYYGVEKLNLNGEHNDPSVMRSKICWDIFRKMEIPAPRSNHVQVYINNNYYGLYISVEHIDEEFVKSRFVYNDGNLFKCLWPADLNYLGDDPELYKLEEGDRRVYQIKTNKEADDYSDLAHYIDVLNNSSSEDLMCKLDSVFNTYDYLKVIAADVLFGNWDGYIYNKNNFYVYHNTTSGKFEFIPYDLDNTLGIDWMSRDWANRNIYDWQQHGDQYRPLYEQIMGNQELRDQYSYYMNQLVTVTIDYDSLKSAVEQRRDMVAQYITNDPYYPLDYGYTIDDFYNSYNESLGGHVAYGIFPYLQTRISSITEQLESTTMEPVIKYIAHNRSSGSDLWIRAYVDVATTPAMVEILFTIEGQTSTRNNMYDDGLHNDGIAGDNIYGGIIENIPESSSLTYQIVATDNGTGETILPCDPVFVPQSGGGDIMLFINEFMASNESTIADEHGDYDDWIEVYNPEDETVWLGDKYLTDKLDKPDKWQMPDAYIEPGEFVLFWADDEPEQGLFHTNFKLKKDGEEIGIFESNMVAIDEIVYNEQTTDISYGRKQDGNSEWIFFNSPTPGSSNDLSDIVHNNLKSGFTLYPNPANGDVVYISEEISYKIYNVYGQLAGSAENYDFINITNYNKGIYVVVSEKGTKQILIVN
jgi:spore coat protein CotH